jgi:hypothetical protein
MAITIDIRGVLLPNSSSPTFASNYPAGNRPGAGVLKMGAIELREVEDPKLLQTIFLLFNLIIPLKNNYKGALWPKLLT